MLNIDENTSLSKQLAIIVRLSISPIFAQIAVVMMGYIDASMVGHLGAESSASIALVITTTWLLGGLCISSVCGFGVLVAQQLGGNNEQKARNTAKLAYIFGAVLSTALACFGLAIHKGLPIWLGGAPELVTKSSSYLFVYVLGLPFLQLNSVGIALLQSTGNMRLPSIINVLMCLLDVVFNSFLIFPTREIVLAGWSFTMPGADLGVVGAALGTAMAEAVTGSLLFWQVSCKSHSLHWRKGESFVFDTKVIKDAISIGLPVCFERIVMSGAQIVGTYIITPLGTISLAAHSFANTAESLCYMPGFGIGTAGVTIIGQTVGAKKFALAKSLGKVLTYFGMATMTVSGIFMYATAPLMMRIFSPNIDIITMGTQALRIEALAEPMFAASIVASGVFRGAGDTLIPSCMNLVSLWLVRLPLAMYLTSRLGLYGFWLAMCIELCFRGSLFMFRLYSGSWLKKVQKKI